MGAWGSGCFENDDAADFLYDFESNGVEALFAAFAATRKSDYLEEPYGSRAIAAAEIVARAIGSPDVDSALPDNLASALESHAKDFTRDLPKLRNKALSALKRIELGESELKDLWQEDDAQSADWLAAIDHLKQLLK